MEALHKTEQEIEEGCSLAILIRLGIVKEIEEMIDEENQKPQAMTGRQQIRGA